MKTLLSFLYWLKDVLLDEVSGEALIYLLIFNVILLGIAGAVAMYAMQQLFTL